jgi:hypothetical protein
MIDEDENINKVNNNEWVHNNINYNIDFYISMEDKNKGQRFEGYKFIEASLSLIFDDIEICNEVSFKEIDNMLSELDLYLVGEGICDTPTQFKPGDRYLRCRELLSKLNTDDNQPEENNEEVALERMIRKKFDTDDVLWASVMKRIKRKIVIKAALIGIVVFIFGLIKVDIEFTIFQRDVFIIAGIVFVVCVSVIGRRFRYLYHLDERQLSDLKD